MPRDGRNLFFLIFTASGFSGLIYESIWTHYLKLFLGHAAYAQALVLAVFMGGMALGSWLCAHFSKRWGNLLLGYALVEAIIGVCAVLFHPVYVRFLDLSYTTLIPSIGSPMIVSIFKWTAASLFILPQSILLGMTFPLMTAGFIRKYPDNPGANIAILYFNNSIGAAIGVLAAGFLLIAWSGLPGTLVAAGMINIVVAAIVWQRVREDAPAAERFLKTTQSPPNAFAYRLLLAVAFMTGASSFIYEIGWIRMLNLVLSSSTHAFELMLSAFIMGLAFGGLWMRRRIDKLQHPVRFLAFVQMAMGILALATLPLYGHTFEIMSWLLRNLEKSLVGYTIFNIVSHSLALLIMLPATFCAGMTLPLITTVLLNEGHGEKSIGAVYAFNTVGCIIGVFIAVHFAMPLLGLKGMLGLGAGIDIALGLALVWWISSSRRVVITSLIGTTVILLTVLIFVKFDPLTMASGVYRTGILLENSEHRILYQKDGKSATVSLTKSGNELSIRTNGKVDASIDLSGNAGNTDEITMVMAGVLPLVLNPNARTAANIGFGSGLTTHSLLSSPQITRVDSIEIEPRMVDAAKYFRPRVERAYTDHRSHIHIEDAKTFFSTFNRKYDIIVSEPSNPWVSGVAGLFSDEFYQRIKSYLNEDGLFVQWLQLYEIDMPLVSSVFNALSSNFEDYSVYASNNIDLIIVASPKGKAPQPETRNIKNELSKELQLVGIESLQDLINHKIGDKQFLGPLFQSYAVPSNSDYYPLLDLYAPRSRFLKINATALMRDLTVVPVGPMLAHQIGISEATDVTFSTFERAGKIHLANTLQRYILSGKWDWNHPDAPLPDTFRLRADMVRRALSDCSGKTLAPNEWLDGMFYIVAQTIIPYSSPAQLKEFWRRYESCLPKLPANKQHFAALLKSVGNRDAFEMSRTARVLLGEMPDAVPSILRSYVLAAGMLGDISSGKAQDAGALWHQYGPALDKKDAQSALMRLLVAHANDAPETRRKE